jgi:hypothetical protein
MPLTELPNLYLRTKPKGQSACRGVLLNRTDRGEMRLVTSLDVCGYSAMRSKEVRVFSKLDGSVPKDERYHTRDPGSAEAETVWWVVAGNDECYFWGTYAATALMYSHLRGVLVVDSSS